MMRKVFSVLLAVMLFVGLFTLAGCKEEKPVDFVEGGAPEGVEPYSPEETADILEGEKEVAGQAIRGLRTLGAKEACACWPCGIPMGSRTCCDVKCQDSQS